jgi:hypothetical protein
MKLMTLLGFFAGATCFALPPHETFYVDGPPSEYQIQQWSLLPGTRSYLFKIGSPYTTDLEIISKLRGADRIRIEVSTFPGEDSWKAWQKLASQGVEFIGLDAGLPSDAETERLIRIGFTRYAFVLPDYPNEVEAARLKSLGAPVSLTFSRNAFPRYTDLPRLQALDHAFPLLFINNLWPFFNHMDAMRMVPQPKSIRITGIYPVEENLEYLQHITGLTGITVDADFEPADGSVWEKFGQIPVTWLSRDHVPTEKALRNLFGSGVNSRKLTLDQDFPLTDEEVARLSASPVSVEWIHAPPFSIK